MMSNNTVFNLAFTASLAALSYAVTSDTMAQVPNVFSPNTPARSAEVNENFTSLDSRAGTLEGRATSLENRVATLEAAAPGGERAFIDVDCGAMPDFFTRPDFQAGSNVTYNLSGVCDGPVVIREDDVELNGVTPDAGVEGPAGGSIEAGFNSVVLVESAVRVNVQNLTIDASNFTTEDDFSCTVFAANGAFLRLYNITSVGGSFGICSYNNAYTNISGTTQIDSFVNSGLTVGGQGAVEVNGPITMFSDNETGSYIDGIEAFNQGYIQINGDLSVNVPFPNDQVDFRHAIFSGASSTIQINSFANVQVTGNVEATRQSWLDISGMTLEGNINVEANSSARIQASVQEFGIVDVINSRLELSSTAISQDLNLDANATVEMFEGSVGGIINVNQHSFARLNSMTGGDLNAGNGNADVFASTLQNINMFGSGQIDIGGDQEGGQLPRVDKISAASGAKISLNPGLVINGGIDLDNDAFLNMSSITYSPGGDFEISASNSKATIFDSTVAVPVYLNDGSVFRIDNSNLSENIFVGNGSLASLNFSTHSGSQIEVFDGRLTSFDADIGRVSLFHAASVNMNRSNFDGADVTFNSSLFAFESVLEGSLNVFPSAQIDISNGSDLSGNNVFLCGTGSNFSSSVDGFNFEGPNSGVAATGTVTDDCAP